MEKSTLYAILIGTVAAALGIGIGVLIGWFSNETPAPSWMSTVERQLNDLDERVITRYVDLVDSDRIRENLMYLAKEPHMATTDGDEALVKYIDGLWKEQLDSSEVVSYEVLLSFPSEDQENKPNVAEVYDQTGQVTFTTKTSEAVYDEYMKAPQNIVPYYNAYAPAGDVEGQLVYANFGSEEDFAYLASQGVDLNGSIALTKYGGVGRGARTINAKKYGVTGVLVYSDPEDYVLEGEQGYPDDYSLPPTGVQRGSTLSEYGDPSTPRYPSLKSAYRTPMDEITYYPVLPLQPINYEDVETLMKMLVYNESLIGDGWSTGLNNKILRVGPGFTDGGKIRLRVNNELRYVTSKNVVGTIKGSTEPDDWIIYGNHRDAWVYGAVDPSSGTACMMETTSVFSNLLKLGWRPKRTIMFASWGAEEFGLIGSTEWAEEKAFLLSDRAITYINVDIAVFANISFFTRASPLLTDVIKVATSEVQDPWRSDRTVLDTWIEHYPVDDSDKDTPLIGKLYTSSDYAYFYNALGISSADLSYRAGNSSDPRSQISPYSTYHTGYDTFDYMERFLDPGFVAHSTVCKVSGAMVIRLADSLIIPFDLTAMTNYVSAQVAATINEYGTLLPQDKLGYLQDASDTLRASVIEMNTYINSGLDRQNLLDIAAVNNRLRKFEKSFIEPLGLPGQLNFRHISGSNYGPDKGSFSSITTALSTNSPPSEEDKKTAQKQLAMITYRLLNAANVLKMK